MSHEIRTPMNAIIGLNDIIMEECADTEIYNHAKDVQSAAKNLLAIINDILDLSKVEAGKMELVCIDYYIKIMADEVIGMMDMAASQRGLILKYECDESIPCRYNGDDGRIKQVLINILNNAIKFTNEGCVCMLVSVRKEKYGINLCVSVKDTGIGMSEESLEKLFESFSQVDARRSRQAGGMGLGLAISRALTLKMGGTITIRSRLGKGSVVRFVVPQKVLREEGIARVENGDLLHVAVYINMEQFHMNFIRDEFAGSISHMAGQLRVKCHMCRNLAELKRRQSHDGFSHIFISLLEYLEDETYFNDLAKRICVVAVIDRPDETFITDAAVMRLYKPF